MYNQDSLDSLCAALTYTMGIEAPQKSAPANPKLTAYVDEALAGKKADRIFMYNPDAIPQWIYEKYPHLFLEAKRNSGIELPFRTVMPSVTPVCFGTMYTGAQPEVHGIRKYEKPVIKIDSIFDTLIRSGKKTAIVAQTNCSMSKIYLERNMDYFIYKTIEELTAKAIELVLSDEYDFIAVHSCNYDTKMHKHGPESIEALAELRHNIEIFATLSILVQRHWKHHNTLLGFAMDHGCHAIDADAGSHGLDMEEDLNIMHLYKAYPATE